MTFEARAALGRMRNFCRKQENVPLINGNVADLSILDQHIAGKFTELVVERDDEPAAQQIAAAVRRGQGMRFGHAHIL